MKCISLFGLGWSPQQASELPQILPDEPISYLAIKDIRDAGVAKLDLSKCSGFQLGKPVQPSFASLCNPCNLGIPTPASLIPVSLTAKQGMGSSGRIEGV